MWIGLQNEFVIYPHPPDYIARFRGEPMETHFTSGWVLQFLQLVLRSGKEVKVALKISLGYLIPITVVSHLITSATTKLKLAPTSSFH